ncbi:hypothetical protein [Dysosmobacter sp.]|uniref:hypothetical protein n=1 Tax=Dysosmobacter sp. TaxID=2591382 RepID=UPI003AB36DA4
MKLAMSDDEIRVSYNTAKDQKAQIKILAELNVTTPAVMAAKLRDLGCNVPDFPSVNQRPLRAHDILFDETRARELFAEGKSDLDIAEMLGIGVYAFAAWRRKNGLKRPRGGDMKKMEQKATSKRCKAQPPMPPEIETPEPEPAPATAAPGSHLLLSAQKQTSAADLGRVLLDLADRYPGIVLTVNGTAVRSLCLNVRVMLGEDTTTSTLDLEVR